mmetsp:Transcript_980/g.2673  ORF Transcript_980/g.2673 Transcript_980/m.2673 type:complete len:275 (+) Transcript_980:104-928(+)
MCSHWPGGTPRTRATRARAGGRTSASSVCGPRQAGLWRAHPLAAGRCCTSTTGRTSLRTGWRTRACHGARATPRPTSSPGASCRPSWWWASTARARCAPSTTCPSPPARARAGSGETRSAGRAAACPPTWRASRRRSCRWSASGLAGRATPRAWRLAAGRSAAWPRCTRRCTTRTCLGPCWRRAPACGWRRRASWPTWPRTVARCRSACSWALAHGSIQARVTTSGRTLTGCCCTTRARQHASWTRKACGRARAGWCARWRRVRGTMRARGRTG